MNIIEKEDPDLMQLKKHASFLRNFNKDYMEILEEDLMKFNDNLRSLYESGDIFRQMGRL